MFPIASITQTQMRRSLHGALATDPVLPEPRRRSHGTHVSPATAAAALRASRRATPPRPVPSPRYGSTEPGKPHTGCSS